MADAEISYEVQVQDPEGTWRTVGGHHPEPEDAEKLWLAMCDGRPNHTFRVVKCTREVMR